MSDLEELERERGNEEYMEAETAKKQRANTKSYSRGKNRQQ
jgi:hypothetical protein